MYNSLDSCTNLPVHWHDNDGDGWTIYIFLHNERTKPATATPCEVLQPRLGTTGRKIMINQTSKAPAIDMFLWETSILNWDNYQK